MPERARKRNIIACATVAEELEHFGVAARDMTVMEFGLHVNPSALKKALQAKIDEAGDGCDILLGYGLCCYAVEGLVSGGGKLVVPRVDDCIALFLGSREERLRRLKDEPGTYYFTKGWVEAADNALTEFDRLRGKYGEERALALVKAITANYTCIAFINTGNYRVEKYRAFAQEYADFLGLKFKEVPGSNRLLDKMLSGEWDSEFVVAEPGCPVPLSPFIGE